MAERLFPDEWLVPTVSTLVPADALATIRGGAEAGKTLWELAVAGGHATDEQILTALAARCRLKMAELKPELRVKEMVPESLARRYHILPLRATDSYLEIATSNPFDLDMEKSLAFATGREVRLLLASPPLDGLLIPE